MSSKICGVLDAGPRVATILVERYGIQSPGWYGYHFDTQP